jgi:DNA-binding NtrC family response regulator
VTAVIAVVDAPVLLTGESGSGMNSPRRLSTNSRGMATPVVAINCAALSPSLIHAELFGAERCVTGARTPHRQ